MKLAILFWAILAVVSFAGAFSIAALLVWAHLPRSAMQRLPRWARRDRRYTRAEDD